MEYVEAMGLQAASTKEDYYVCPLDTATMRFVDVGTPAGSFRFLE
jgi:hypothetical protein